MVLWMLSVGGSRSIWDYQMGKGSESSIAWNVYNTQSNKNTTYMYLKILYN